MTAHEQDDQLLRERVGRSLQVAMRDLAGAFDALRPADGDEQADAARYEITNALAYLETARAILTDEKGEAAA